MKIERVQHDKEMSIDEFASKHNLTMLVEDFGESCNANYKSSGRFTAHFKYVNVKNSEELVRGYGSDERAAIIDYISKISRRTLVMDSGSKRTEIYGIRLTAAWSNQDL